MTYAYSQMSLIALPLLTALTSISFEPFEGGDLDVPRGIVNVLYGLRSLTRLQLQYCMGWKDEEEFSLGRAVPSLRILIVDETWAYFPRVDHKLGTLEHLECPINFWDKLVIGSISAHVASLVTRQELHLCQAMSRDNAALSLLLSTLAQGYALVL